MNRLKGGLLLAALAPIGAEAGAQQREPYPGFDAYVNAALATWKVPGAAIAIVRNDSVIFAKGYGVQEIGKPTPVDARTIFAIGSASKAFTAAAAAILVDDRKLRWDEPAATYLPELRLFDPYASREITVRDLLSHRSGLARGDLLWYGTQFDRDEILRRVRYLQPSWSFRSQFGYQNLMYLAAGQSIARLANVTWDEFVRSRILEPLGMTTSNTSTRQLPTMTNVASPHAEIDDTVRVVPWRNIDNIAPAGSINSNALEMTRWVRLQLNHGKVGDRQLITSAQVDEMHKPHTIVPLEGVWKLFNPASNFMLYGMGWFLQDFRGKKVVQHGGNIDGMSALVALMPEERFGMVVLTNMGGSPVPYALMHRTFDLHLKMAPRDWSAEMFKTVEANRVLGRDAQKRLDAQRVSGTTPSLPLAQYVGTYVDSMYGEAVVSERNGRLHLSRGPAIEGALEHWHFDTFRANWRDRSMGKTFVSFRLGASGKTDDLQVDLGGAPVTYRRRADLADTTAGTRIAAADLAKYVGRFESKAPPITVTVERLGELLRLSVPGQPAYTLIPVTATRFTLTGPNVPAGFFLVYAMDGAVVKSVTLEQPAPQPSLTLTPVR